VSFEELWPDSATFWRDKRVVVTGGAGSLGLFIVEKHQARDEAESHPKVCGSRGFRPICVRNDLGVFFVL